MGRNFLLRPEPGRIESCGFSARGTLGAMYTGRSINVEGEYPVAKEWLETYEHSPGARPELEHQFLQSLGRAEASTFEAPVFRGRFFSNPLGSCQDFGPPLPSQTPRGRYNAEGEPALYLCSSVNGVKRELAPLSQGCRLWIQQFHILPELRMADAREFPIDSFAAAVFWLIESGRDHRLPPRLGEKVAQLLIDTKYDGLIVPGVRGEPDERYWNAVVFRPEARWRGLVDRSVLPQEVSYSPV